MAHPTGFEPVTFGFVGGSGGDPAGANPSQSIGNTHLTREGEVQGSQLSTGLFKNSATQVLPDLRLVDGGRDRLLSVRQVAERLGMSTATIYSLVEREELAHVRVSNAIRVRPVDLDAFIEARRRGGLR